MLKNADAVKVVLTFLTSFGQISEGLRIKADQRSDAINTSS